MPIPYVFGQPHCPHILSLINGQKEATTIGYGTELESPFIQEPVTFTPHSLPPALPHALPPILDACCGPRMMHVNKKNPLILAMDKRNLSCKLCDGRSLEITPDLLADFTRMPFPDESFHLVIFDPPHLNHAGKKSFLAIKYDVLPKDFTITLAAGFDECWRVLKPNGTLVFKWSTVQIPLAKLAPLFPAVPVIHTSTQKTHILLFFKS